MANASPDALCAICRPIPVAWPQPPRTEADSSQKPQTLNSNLGNLPAALEPLTALPYWLLWRWQRDKKGKGAKNPYQPKGQKGKEEQPAAWVKYDQGGGVAHPIGRIGSVPAQPAPLR